MKSGVPLGPPLDLAIHFNEVSQYLKMLQKVNYTDIFVNFLLRRDYLLERERFVQVPFINMYILF